MEDSHTAYIEIELIICLFWYLLTQIKFSDGDGKFVYHNNYAELPILLYRYFDMIVMITIYRFVYSYQGFNNSYRNIERNDNMWLAQYTQNFECESSW